MKKLLFMATLFSVGCTKTVVGPTGAPGKDGTSVVVKTYKDLIIPYNTTYTLYISEITQSVIDSGEVFVQQENNYMLNGCPLGVGYVGIHNSYPSDTFHIIKVTIIP